MLKSSWSISLIRSATLALTWILFTDGIVGVRPSLAVFEPVAVESKPEAGEPVSQLPQDGDSLAQVTSVSELSDVKPTDWAFQAVQSLVERYGCIEGYPDKTFQGNQAATRYELAAALNTCLNQISDQLGGLTPEDLATIKRLQDEFAAELAALRGRVDGLEARTAEVEANQFSTTTKLVGEVITLFTSGQDGNGDGASTVINRTRLSFNTSFSGDDLLFTQLQMGNGGQSLVGAETADSPFLYLSRSTGAFNYYEGVGAEPRLHQLFYEFKPGRHLSVTIGPRIFHDGFVDLNTYANASARDFNTDSFINNTLIMIRANDLFGAAGAAAVWNIEGGPVTLRAVYTAASPTNAVARPIVPTVSGPGGLFGDPYQGTFELEYSPSDEFAVRLQYTNAVVGEVKYNTYGINAEATLGQFGIFGRYGFGSLNGFGAAAAVDLNPQTFVAGIAIEDLLISDSRLAFAVGQPFAEDDVCALASGAECSSTQTNFEAFYRFPHNDNITITPAFILVTDVNNDSSSPTIYQGVLRTVFTF